MTDNINRATSIGGVMCANDILGNWLSKGTALYGWDTLNRMTSYTAGGVTTSYVYRSDGMRVSKTYSTGSAVYRYDGQMAMQDVETVGTSVTTTNYALGARGIDAVSKTDSSGTSVGYPIYDGHGNRTATLTKSGTSFSLTDVRTYDAWGNVRVGAQTGRPRARYCANLGHVQDDESSLVYMRARYYEPTSGRFVSQDPARNGLNWFSYSRNDPVNYHDVSGKYGVELIIGGIALLLLGVGAIVESPFLLLVAVIVFVGALIYGIAEAIRDACEGVKVLSLSDMEEGAFERINSLKVDGSIAQKIGAATAELMIWVTIAMGGEEDE